MRRIAILCGLCLVMTGAAASGAPLSSSSRAARHSGTRRRPGWSLGARRRHAAADFVSARA